MRHVRRITPLVRVPSLVGLLYLLACGAVLIISLVLGTYAERDGSGLSIAVVMGPFYLGLAGSYAVLSHRKRLRRLDRGGFVRLDSCRSQLRALGVLLVLPLCALPLAVFLPPTVLAFGVVFALSVLAGLVLIVASATIVFGAPSRAPMRTPPAG